MNLDPDLPLGRRLAVIRVARGFTQRDVALTAGLPPSTLSMIEHGYRQPRDHEMAAILHALGIRRADLGTP
jgi:transcriptional regulator with XRE-family HTH domain